MDKNFLTRLLLTITLLLGPGLQSAQPAGNDGQSSKPPKLKLWNQSTLEAWWREHPGAKEIISGTRNLLVTLQSAQQQHGLGRVLANEHFLGWLKHLAWVRLFPPDFASDAFFSKPENFYRVPLALLAAGTACAGGILNELPRSSCRGLEGAL